VVNPNKLSCYNGSRNETKDEKTKGKVFQPSLLDNQVGGCFNPTDQLETLSNFIGITFFMLT